MQPAGVDTSLVGKERRREVGWGGGTKASSVPLERAGTIDDKDVYDVVWRVARLPRGD